MRDTIITIGDDGSLNFVANEALAELAGDDKTTTRRASHVLPTNTLLRAIFRWLRDRCGEKGLVASFTRRWPCIWQADLAPSNGPVLGPFRRRQDAIDAEIAWLEANIG
jgi:hypothetical protein